MGRRIDWDTKPMRDSDLYGRTWVGYNGIGYGIRSFRTLIYGERSMNSEEKKPNEK
jgi:hypothetical protein